ncbi:MAG: T9SS type A sorting domain-containing protein [Bacteroidota bacterium]
MFILCPAKDIITISFGNLITNGKIEIFSVDTKILKRESINGLSAKREINISGLPQGVYFIRLWNGSSNELLRFIKE